MAKWVIDVISSTSYVGIVLLMFMENVFPPIPSEFIIPLAGYMVTQRKLSLVGVIIAGTAGSVIGWKRGQSLPAPIEQRHAI